MASQIPCRFIMTFLAHILVGADSLLKILTHRERFL